MDEKNADKRCAGYSFKPAEWKAIEVHRYFLSQKFRREVSINETIDNWLKYFSEQWRRDHPLPGGGENELLSLAEWQAIQVHKYFLSQKSGQEVSSEDATKDWLEHYAQKWRQERMKMSCSDQLKEIEKFKWLESERAGHDKGKEAVLEWIEKYADQWRMKWEKNHGN